MKHRTPCAHSALKGVLVWIALSCVPAAHAGESYYVLIFGSQSEPKRPRYTHTWATFVRATTGEDEPRPEVQDGFTVSWMPRTLNVRPLAPRPEPGVNLTLWATLKAMTDQGQRVSMWGPYLIDGRTFEHAAAHKARLESGGMQYKALDSYRPSPTVTNCMHAVCDALGIPRSAVSEIQVQGEGASEAIAGVVRAKGGAAMPGPYDWMIEQIGLKDYPINRR